MPSTSAHHHEADRRRALSEFLRAKREHLTPAQCGLPTGSRRRTPGLRREEVADLCGMSTTWYSWIEQGRDVQASPATLARLAQALRLTPAERAYMFTLAGRSDPAPAQTPPIGLPAALAVLTQQTLNRPGQNCPTYVLDRLWHALAWNDAARDLFTGWLDGGTPDNERNLLLWIFTSPQARTMIDDWENRARRVVAEFRADCGPHLDDPTVVALVQHLRDASPHFSACWDDQTVLSREGGLRRFHHPRFGACAYEQLTLIPTSRPDCKLVILTAAPGDKIALSDGFIPLSTESVDNPVECP